jgi:hypothetical protein
MREREGLVGVAIDENYVVVDIKACCLDNRNETQFNDMELETLRVLRSKLHASEDGRCRLRRHARFGRISPASNGISEHGAKHFIWRIMT